MSCTGRTCHLDGVEVCFSLRSEAVFSIIMLTAAPVFRIALAFTELPSFTRVTVTVCRKRDVGVVIWSAEGGVAAVHAGVGVGGDAGCWEAEAESRSRWRRVWCLAPQVLHENLFGHCLNPCRAEKQLIQRRCSRTNLLRLSTS